MMEIQTLSRQQWLELFGARDAVRFLRCRRWKHAAPHQNDSRHMPNHLVVFVESARILIRGDEQVLECERGDVVWIPPGVVRHSSLPVGWAAETDYRLHFQTESADGVRCRFSDGVVRKPDAWELLPLFQMLARCPEESGSTQNDYARGLLLALASRFQDLRGRRDAGVFSAHDRERIRSYLDAHNQTRIEPTALAACLSLSPDYFSRKFRRTFGTSPKTYIKQDRIRAAADYLLETDAGIKEAAWDFGYRDVNLFCRQFREVTGHPPGQYRNSQRH